jgi:hypothetical protein
MTSSSRLTSAHSNPGFVLEPPYVESVASHNKTRSARSTPGVQERIRSLAVLKVGRPKLRYSDRPFATCRWLHTGDVF